MNLLERLVGASQNLIRKRHENSVLLYSEFVSPVLVQFEKVHEDYMATFRAYRQSIMDGRKFDGAHPVFEKIEEDKLFSASMRGKLYSLVGGLGNWEFGSGKGTGRLSLWRRLKNFLIARLFRFIESMRFRRNTRWARLGGGIARALADTADPFSAPIGAFLQLITLYMSTPPLGISIHSNVPRRNLLSQLMLVANCKVEGKRIVIPFQERKRIAISILEMMIGEMQEQYLFVLEAHEGLKRKLLG